LALELFETAHERRREGSLLWCIDRTLTAAGSRLLRDWLGEPLIQLESIQQRQDAVHNLFEDPSLRAALREELRGISDIERITSRLSARRTHPRDLAQLRDSLLSLPRLRATLDGVTSSSLLKQIRSQLEAPPGLAERLTEALETAPPLNLKEGGYIRAGYSKDLDELRALRSNSKDLLAALQQRESERTGIPNLKVGYNSVFGYYIEITNSHKDRAPDDYIRKQTLKNAERYITPELKEHEGRVLSAEERALSLEQELFEQVRQEAAQHVAALQELAHQIAQLDVLGALAEVSVEQSFVRPQMDDSTALEIEAGCHPVLARTLGRQHFVPNDCHLGGKRAPFAVITGPNMAGKSTYLRQTALLVLLAQMGCFVPARRARIGVVDQIFTRVGAADDLARGASTFMVEMTETANILHHATPRSLVILDEIGRGTGTFDGLSLARAVSEHLAEQVHCRALFATHYHQLTQLAEEFESVCNLTVAVREWGEEIVFLHEILPGGTDRSYGIQVARLAGIPRSVLARAQTLLRELEATDLSPKQARDQEPEIRPPESAAAETAVHKVIQRLRRLDVDRLTPLEALNFLARMQTELDRTHARLQRTRRRPQGPSLFDTATGAGG
jgi:DNA mismatch repair protein MutS